MSGLALIHQIDVRLYTFLNGFAGDWLLDRVVSEEERNQLLKGGLFLALYWYAWFRPDPAQTRRRKRIVTAVAATLGALACARVLAMALPFRMRPMFEHGLPHMSFAIPIHPNMEAWSAFPSDTATYFFALAIGLTYVERAMGRWLLLFAATWICIPRLYIGLHYLSDILAGVALAAIIVPFAMGSQWIERKIAAPILESEKHAGVFYSAAFLLSMEMANLFDSTRSLMHGVLQAVRMGPHHEMVAALGTLVIVATAAAAFAWRRRSGRLRVTVVTSGD